MANLAHEFSTSLKPSKSSVDSIDSADGSLGLPYPQGCIQWYPNGLILAAGGAGPTKSGLANGFEILQFERNDSNAPHQFALKRHSWYNTGPDIVYCIRQHPRYPYQFIAGIGNHLAIMEMSSNAAPAPNRAFEYDWRRIGSMQYPTQDPVHKSPIETIAVRANVEQTVLANEAPCSVQKIGISSSGKLVASGGTDGVVRVWKYDFVDPSQTLCLTAQIDVTAQHTQLMGQRQGQEPLDFEDGNLLFDAFSSSSAGSGAADESTYLAMCCGQSACYVYNVRRNKMQTILMEKKNSAAYVFRDCAFLSDGDGLRYCVCAVNGVRASRRSGSKPSYLYQYFIDRESEDAAGNDAGERHWYRINYRRIMKEDVRRMIVHEKSNNLMTLHLNGMVCVFDGLNLNMLYSLKNDGIFFVDIAVSPNLYGTKENEYCEYLLVALLNNLLIKPVKLTPCVMDKSSRTNWCCCCCSGKCLIYVMSVVMVLIGVLIAFIQQNI